MKKSIFLGILLLPLIAFGQDQISDIEFLKELLNFITSIKGAGSLAIIAGAVQLLMMLLKTPFISKFIPKLTGVTKILIVSGLTVVSGVIALMVEGQTFLAALLSSANLAAIQVFANQLFKQFTKKEEPKQ